MSTEDLTEVTAAMTQALTRPWVVALDAVIETASGKIAFVAHHSDGRNVALMTRNKGITHDDMVAMAQAAFDSQHQGVIPA